MGKSLNRRITPWSLLSFAAPSIIMMVFMSLYTIVDGIFVSRFVGSNALSSLNIVYPVVNVAIAIAMMLASGGNAIISKYLGEGNKKRACESLTQFVTVCILVSLVIVVISQMFLTEISRLLGSNEVLLADCKSYLGMVSLFIPACMLQTLFQMYLVTAGRPTMGLLLMIGAGIVNAVLDYVLIVICDMGVAGAALATGISQFVGSVIPIIYFAGGKNNVLKLTKCCFNKDIIIKTCINGSSEMVTNMSMSLVNILYNMQLMKYIGTNGVVAYGIIMYVGFIFVGTYMGYAVGSAPVISYHYGAGNKDELKNLFKRSLTIIIVSSVVMTLIAEIIAGYLAGIFVSYDNNLLELTTEAIRIYAVSYLISGINIFASSFFTALNNGVVSAVISFMRMFVFQIVMILLLPVVLGISGIWTAVIAAEVLSVVISVLFLVKNRKKYSY